MVAFLRNVLDKWDERKTRPGLTLCCMVLHTVLWEARRKRIQKRKKKKLFYTAQHSTLDSFVSPHSVYSAHTLSDLENNREVLTARTR